MLCAMGHLTLRSLQTVDRRVIRPWLAARGERFKRGSLRQEQRKAGITWVLRFYARKGPRRVERTIALGLVSEFRSEAAAWAEVNRLRLHEQINKPDYKGSVTFADLARRYEEHELGDQVDSADPKSHTTIAGYEEKPAAAYSAQVGAARRT